MDSRSYGSGDISQITPTIQDPEQWSYVSKVLNYVGSQLLVTSLISCIAYIYRESVISFANQNPGLVIWVPIILTFGSLIGLYCNKNPALRQTLFWVFTVSMSVLVGLSVLSYSPTVVTKAVVATFCVVVGVNIYSRQAAAQGKSFSSWGPMLCGCLLGLIVVSILQIFIQSSVLGFLISLGGVILFTGFLMYDLNRLYQKGGEYQEDPLLAAVGIYLDIINLFLYMLDLMRRINGDK